MRPWEKERQAEERVKRSFMDKVLNFLGFVAEDVQVDEEELVEEPEPVSPRRAKPRVVSLQSAQRQFKVVVFEPKSFDDVQGIVDQLKNHRPVIVNLEETERSLAKRVVDFMSGAVYALAGGMQQINPSIFLFTPANVEITLGPRAEPRERASFFNLGH